jgi:hypothetical protein
MGCYIFWDSSEVLEKAIEDGSVDLQLEKLVSINVKPIATKSNTFSFEQHYQFSNYYKRHTQ